MSVRTSRLTHATLINALRDNRVDGGEAQRLVEVAKQGGFTAWERGKIQGALNHRGDAFTPEARMTLDQFLGNGAKAPAAAAPAAPAVDVFADASKPDMDANLWMTNVHRSQIGKPSMAIDGRLSLIAHDWAKKMAAAGGLSHRPDLGGAAAFMGAGNWKMLGENVGVGGSEADIRNAWMNSPAHRANIENGDFNAFGVGAYRDPSGKLWMVQVFAKF